MPHGATALNNQIGVRLRLMQSLINAERALIFRVTHIKNVPWILGHGLHCNNSNDKDESFIGIGNPELIEKRRSRVVPVQPGGTLSDYIPFYFTPFSMMMYNIRTGYGGVKQYKESDIVFVVTSLRTLEKNGQPTIFTDRHAYLRTARFFSSLDMLSEIDWGLLQRKDFRKDPDDPEKTDRYQAEALVHQRLPIAHIVGIVCHGANEKGTIERLREAAGVELRVVAQPSWYFS